LLHEYHPKIANTYAPSVARHTPITITGQISIFITIKDGQISDLPSHPNSIGFLLYSKIQLRLYSKSYGTTDNSFDQSPL